VACVLLANLNEGTAQKNPAAGNMRLLSRKKVKATYIVLNAAHAPMAGIVSAAHAVRDQATGRIVKFEIVSTSRSCWQMLSCQQPADFCLIARLNCPGLYGYFCHLNLCEKSLL